MGEYAQMTYGQFGSDQLEMYLRRKPKRKYTKYILIILFILCICCYLIYMAV